MTRPLTCAFCGKDRERVRRLIAGPDDLCICDGCVTLCREMLADDAPPGPQLRPREIHALLDRHVIGQEHAKRTLAVAVHNHLKRTRHAAHGEIGKSNVLLVGPTGSGKTHLVRTLARSLDVPLAIVDSTTLTQAGYVGEDVETALLALLRAADHDLRRAEHGIVYLDEFDKLAQRGGTASAVRDVSGEGVQQALLKILEGTVAHVPPHGGRRHPQDEYIPFDTTHVLFIAGGAFTGLDDIAERRAHRPLGFGHTPPPAPAAITPADLREFGLISELVGRLPILSVLHPLDRATLARTLTEPRDALLRQYGHLLALDGVTLEVTPAAIEAIADRAIGLGTGARAARTILEDLLRDVMFEIPSRPDVSHVVITAETVRNGTPPTLVPHDRAA